jgi:hypothetical protein
MVLPAACGGDDSVTGSEVVTIADLVGIWIVEIWEYSRASDTTQKADWVVTKGLTGNLNIGSDGSFTVTPALDGGTGSDDGHLTVQGDSIYWDGQNDEEWVQFELGSTLTVRWPETSFVDMDQDSSPEDAWLRVVFRRS